MESFFSHDYATWTYGSLLTAILFVIIWLRYLVFSFGFYWSLFKWWQRPLAQRHLSSKPITHQQLRKEISWSTLTSLFFALSGTLMVIAWQRGYTQLYTDLSAYSCWMIPLSIIIALFLQETYYYWIHRWMHRPKVYRKIHKVHHDSIQTSAMTSFSFHPYEAMLQAIITPIIVLIIPMHIYVLFGLLALMTISGTLNHAGVELYPSWLVNSRIGKWMIGATHHDLHHKQFRYNFGLYFTFWDRWMGTESPKYGHLIAQKVGLSPNSKSHNTQPSDKQYSKHVMK